jgi:hypothetical protein
MSCRALACRDARRAVAAVTLIEAFARSCLEARLEWRIGSPWPFWRDDRWVDKGPIGEGESASIRVQNDFNAMIGVSKPGLSKAAETDHCRAAHEKLAFDLAYNAELPVGAVVLWGEAMPPQYKRGRSISSWTFPQAINWSDANRRVGHAREDDDGRPRRGVQVRAT